ncbi:hypothetical protein [Sphingopyxis sp.]|uniref:hypothetical protein n=1 Tax=Sphingopyxis sp. TaxID=1908224 RepID=UPI0025D4588D|nr:hypothetical protein [Sphingopyxis sp.]
MSASPVSEDGTIDWSHLLICDLGWAQSMRIFDRKKPVLGAINGAAVGIGKRYDDAVDGRSPAMATARYGFVFAPRDRARKRRRAGSCPASSASRMQSTGAIRAARSTPPKHTKRGPVQSVHKPRAAIDAAIAKSRELGLITAPRYRSRSLATCCGACSVRRTP